VVYQNYAPRQASIRWVWWTLAGIGALVFAVIITVLVSAGFSESAKIQKMVAIADGIPASDWELTHASDPKHDITCIPFDQSCHKLSRTWRVADPVHVDELDATTGYDLEVGTVYRPDCADGWVDGVSIRLCVDGSDIDLTMRD
jgi:hypothetical protein